MPVTLLDSSAHRLEDFDTGRENLPALWRMEEKHFWHAARNEWILGALARYSGKPKGSFLEVGCGSGAVAVALARVGYDVTGVDTCEELIRKAAERLPGSRIVCGEVGKLPRALQGPYDLVGLFDVLEHLSEPETLLRESLAWAKPGAWVIATVPARKDRFSVIDKLGGHKRRYDTSELKALFESVGLTDVREHGIFRWLAPLVYRRRAQIEKKTQAGLSPEVEKEIRQMDTQVPLFVVNRILHLACFFERRFGFASSENQSGASLMAVGRKAF